jgi:deoxyribodipyrimidine photolyase-like uncharacterized protein
MELRLGHARYRLTRQFCYRYRLIFLERAITTLVRELYTTAQVIRGIIAAYALTIACLMLLGGFLTTLLGWRVGFVRGRVIASA